MRLILPFAAIVIFAAGVSAQGLTQVKINTVYPDYNEQYDRTSFNLIAMPVKAENALGGRINLLTSVAGRTVTARPDTMILTVLWIEQKGENLPGKIKANIIVDNKSVLERDIERYEQPDTYSDGFAAAYPIDLSTDTFAVISSATTSVKITLGDRAFFIEKDGIAKFADYMALITPKY